MPEEAATTDVTPEPVEAPAAPDFSAMPEGELDRAWVEGLHAQYTSAAEAAKSIDEWGGKDTVAEAIRLQQSIATDEGVVDIFLQAGKSLGLGVKEMEALFAGATPEEESALDGLEDDETLTVSQVKKLLEEMVTKPLQKQSETQSQRELAAKQQNAQVTISAELTSLGVTDQSEIDAILRLGEKHLKNDDYDPESIKAALRKGKAEMDSIVDRRQKDYLTKKAADAKGAPSSTASASPGGVTLPEPKNVEEARQRVRARMRAEQ